MNYRLINFNPVAFLNTFWQKRPAVFRGVFENFIDPLDEHELAGLAMEDALDSRIVSRQGNTWQVTEGPFTDFSSACQHHWSLLVQSVEQYHAGADSLMSAFNFIPHWRTDNLMVSYSVKGAGVGAHIDQYDVFIIQGKGRRRWQIGQPGKYESFSPHPALSQIRDFDAVIDEILEPGDMIYIPPGYPHRGETLNDCLNYSVGFRGPTYQQLLDSFANTAMEKGWFTTRLCDPERNYQIRPDEISHQDINKVRDYFHQMVDSDQFLRWFGQHAAQRCSDQEDVLAEQDGNIQSLTGKPVTLIRQPGIRPIVISAEHFKDKMARVFVEEHEFTFPDAESDLIRDFVNATDFYFDPELCKESSLFFNRIVYKLVSCGYWWVESSADAQ